MCVNTLTCCHERKPAPIDGTDLLITGQNTQFDFVQMSSRDIFLTFNFADITYRRADLQEHIP